MDNRTAFWIAFLIICVFLADHYYFEWGLPATIGKIVADISEWLAFWR